MDFGMPFLMELASVEEAAQLCSELGLSFVELNSNFPPCLPENLSADRLRAIAQRYHIYFTLHVEEECDSFSFNQRVRAAWLKTVQDAVCLAEVVGMPILNMHLPRGVYITLPEEKVLLYRAYRKEYHAAIRSFIRQVEAVTAGSSVRLCIENTGGWQPHEREAIEMLLVSPAFGLTMDVGHCHCAGDVDEGFILAHSDRLLHMHGHDAMGLRDHLPLGDGEVDLHGRFALAQSSGARIVLETKTIAALKQSVARLPQYL